MVNFIKLLCEKNLLREFGGCQEAFQRRYYAAHNIAEASCDERSIPVEGTGRASERKKLENDETEKTVVDRN